MIIRRAWPLAVVAAFSLGLGVEAVMANAFTARPTASAARVHPSYQYATLETVSALYTEQDTYYAGGLHVERVGPDYHSQALPTDPNVLGQHIDSVGLAFDARLSRMGDDGWEIIDIARDKYTFRLIDLDREVFTFKRQK